MKVREKNHNRGREWKLTARNREERSLEQTKQAERSKERSSGGGLIGQRQTERQDLPLSIQRERKQTPSAERRRQNHGQLGDKKRSVKAPKIAMVFRFTFQ